MRDLIRWVAVFATVATLAALAMMAAAAIRLLTMAPPL